ncbi:MAG TPA: glycoside hydrolase family 130 protein [Deltaproteobacteria bacterium]|nr:glycoside hydrolase family 130 protein [Deltaproteobacteria bacterium]HOM29790.1 glycoside hydrolase family 130 protein [Deltaproteobacteria bacterium]HPP81328.1 glycoside hydrolase family 130 protein [Deltaproteobacteria bacterium]
MGKERRSIVERYPGNPILTKDDVPYPVETVHNAAVVKHAGGYTMLFRSHLKNGRSVIGIADSRDGYAFTVRDRPFVTPATEGPFAQVEEFGVEDPRITLVEGEYLVTYSAYSRFGVRVVLARTADFEAVERIAVITQADCRNVVLFPERIGGRYVRLDRPHSEIMPWSIWMSSSPDLVHWGESKPLISPMTYHWDEMKVGPGSPPVKTERGWLHVFHGVFKTMDGAVYRLGTALHDLADPSRVIGVADEWILQPEDPWEVTGYVHNVVFCCAMVPEDDRTAKIYWGGADTVVCAGTVDMEELVRLCIDRPRPPL